MSMSVEHGSALTGMRQNTRVLAAEKQEKASTPDVGRTRQSSVSASLDQANLGEDGIAVTEAGRLQGAEQSAVKKPSSAPRTDTVEISREGRAASARLQAQSAGTAVEALQDSVEDLSGYTDSELKQMYLNGEITRQEYEEETGETLA